jgi:hypothetical protein
MKSVYRYRLLSLFVFFIGALWAVVFGSVRGVVHDPDVVGAHVLVKSTTSDFSRTLDERRN